MTTSRLAEIPWDHIICEMVAFPFASEVALNQGLTELDPRLGGATEALWRTAERELLSALPSLALDELLALRDALWFDQSSPNHGGGLRERSLGDYLRSTVSWFLRDQGSTAVPDIKSSGLHGKNRTSGVHARSVWRWLSFALPPDLLLAALGREHSGPAEVDVLSPLLDQRLRDGGFAELHLHLGAALDFKLLWLGALHALASPELKEEDLQSPGAGLDEGRKLAPWLLRAVIARYLLGTFLAQRAPGQMLHDWLDEVPAERSARLGATGRAALQVALAELLNGNLLPEGPGFRELQHVYNLMTSVRAITFPEELERAWEADPLAPFLPAGAGGRTPEIWLVASGLEYMARAGKDRLFHKLFWQSVRLRCILYRHVVQRPMTPGLHWFMRFFNRLGKLRRPVSRSTQLMLRSALELEGSTRGLRALEVKLSPEASLSEMLRRVQDLQQVVADIGSRATSNSAGLQRPRESDNQDPPVRFVGQRGDPVLNWQWDSNNSGAPVGEVGYVLHFPRDRGGQADRGKPPAFRSLSHAAPATEREEKADNAGVYRYSTFYRRRREEAFAVARLLESYPLSLEWIRGLDLCADEMGVPVWVMAPLIRYVREVSEATSRVLRQGYRLNVPPLRVSVHAGEDFVHLLSGLRMLDEAVEWLGLREGDRIGHGLSLGVDAEKWSARAGRIVMPAEERLFDLVWEWNWRSSNGGQLTRNRHLLIEREIAELSEKIFGESRSPLEAYRLVEALHSEEQLRWVRFPDGPVIDRARAEPGERGADARTDLLFRFLTDARTFQRGRQMVPVYPAQEAEALMELQSALRRKIGEKEIVIEVNPSSNLLIGHLSDLGNHPLWRLRPQAGGDGVPPLALSIGSDDPITFATSLRQEYQLLHDTLVLKGCSFEEAEAWIEEIRRTSLAARFTVPWSGLRVEDILVVAGPYIRPPP